MSTTTAVFTVVQQAGRFRWQLTHNGTMLAQSGVTYSRKRDATRAFNRTQAAIVNARPATVKKTAKCGS